MEKNFMPIEKELTDILPVLPTGIQYGRFTQNVAYTLMARLYLNAEVFTGTPQWQKCIDACEKVQGYSLSNDYKAPFAIENAGNQEIIFAIPYDHKQGTVGNYLLVAARRKNLVKKVRRHKG